MIHTLTLNPSIDYLVTLDQVALGQVNRSQSEEKFPGGKGINVSRILSRLGDSTKALGFIGGFTGNFIIDVLQAEGIETDFISVQGDSRINLKLKADKESEINGQGPVISPEDLDKLKTQLSQLPAGDTLVFAGSANPNLGNQVYQELIPLAKAQGVRVVCDFEGQTLVDTLPYRPFLVKPNNHELGAIFQVDLKGHEDVVHYGRILREKGAENVLISMAGDGAILVYQEGEYFAKPIQGKVQNSVGAGDSMVAGFISGYEQNQDPIEALKWGVACGTATAFSKDLATKEEIEQMYQKVEVEKL